MLEDKARELGRLIGQSAEYQAVKRANDALQGDPGAMTLLRKMEELRLNAQKMIERGEQPTEQMEQDLDRLLGQVQGSTLYQGAVSAQENFDKVMLRVNDWIFEGIKKGSASSIITLG
ncbi:MAG: YlbF family regulator [Gemmatimonadaceae bacterium]